MDILIASDIDGTLTDLNHSIPLEVLNFLQGLNGQGVDLLFVTGRPFFRGYRPLQTIQFPYLLAVYNGSLIFAMPDKEIIFRSYLGSEVLPEIANFCEGTPTDVVIYGGYEHNDVCYYRPDRFSHDLLKFLNYRCEFLNEKWVKVASFDDVPIRVFPSVKCFGTKDLLLPIQKTLEERLEVIAPIISDALHQEYCIAQITKRGVDKGKTIETIKALNPNKNYKTIACGDDFNDLQMLLQADIAVVMATAPQELLAIADVIAPPAKDHGIIIGIKQALQLLGL
jgi:Cof subfamily protein (haloacid dehalogenase superfamily)